MAYAPRARARGTPDMLATADKMTAGSPAAAGAEPPLIEVRGVSFRSGQLSLLQSVDLVVGPREIVSLVGPNGAGKTTLLRVMLGGLAPSSGEVRKRPGLTIGYVPQRLQADPILPITLHRMLTLGQRPNPGTLAEIMAETGIQRLGHSLLHELSGGELQRALLARALLRAPDLLILDEPTQGIDFNGQLELYHLIEQVRDRRGCGILLVSHDLHLVMRATDRVVCLNRHVCCSGRPESVSRDPAYRQLFGPAAAAGLAIYSHHHNHVHDLAGDVVDPTPSTVSAPGAADAR